MQNQKALAHLAVDEGADLVIGRTTHMYLKVLKNIMENTSAIVLVISAFGGNSTPSDTDSMIVQQTFTFNQKRKINEKQ